MTVLYRYVSYEITKTVLITFLLFLFVILMDRASQIAETVLGQGVSFYDFLSVLVKTLPSFFGIVVPISFVLSVLISFIQMEANNELTALKSCGISLKQVSIPVIVLGVLFSAFSFYSTMFLAPKSNVAVKKEVEALVKKKITMSISSKNFSSNFPGVTFYASKVYPKKGIIENFMVSIQKKNKLITIFGKKGSLRTENNSVFLDVFNGSAQVLDWNKPNQFQFLTFKNYTFQLYRFSNEEKFEAKKYKTLAQLLKMKDSESQTEILKRFCLSLSPLIVGVFAFSVAVSLPRGSMGMGISVGLLTVVSYYVIYTFSKKFAFSSGIPPLALLPDLVFGVLAAVFYYLAVKEKLNFYAGMRW
jgi:LPS export ABC transporter permease LptF